MDFGEFSDVSLDTNDTDNFKSCDTSFSLSDKDTPTLTEAQAGAQEIETHIQAGAYTLTNDADAKLNVCGIEVENNRTVCAGGQIKQNPSDRRTCGKQTIFSSPSTPGYDEQAYDLFPPDDESDDTGRPPSQDDTDSIHCDLFYAHGSSRPTEQADKQRSHTACLNSDTESDSQSLASQLVSENENGEPSDGCSPQSRRRDYRKKKSKSSFDELLFDLYDKHGGGSGRLSISSSVDGSSTDCSSISEFLQAHEPERISHSEESLQEQGVEQLKELVLDLSNKVNQKNTQLVKCLRNRERHRTKAAKHCDMVTAVIQAWSTKSSADAKMKFTIEPPAGRANYNQWRDAITSLVRRPIGLPSHFRSNIWLSLASEYIRSLQLDWNKIVQFAFNDKCNPDDDALGAQIVKDLHRTGCSTFSGIENEEDRVILQRVLLGYARWNKVTGYCQGFNILAAFILNVTNKNEFDALKIMIYLVDHMLPKEYFAHNLRALTVDMAVFRSYLNMKLPKLSAHLAKLQHESCDDSTGVNVEPPLTNVFTMQWFLTLFATCLPMATVLKIWDCVMIDGSEILIRTALALWTKLAKKIIRAKTADEFYMTMGLLTQQLMKGEIVTADELVHSIYNMAPIPLPKLTEIREKYMYDITPFSAAMNSASHKAAHGEGEGSDDMQELAKKEGAASYNSSSKSHHTMDVALLKRQYAKLTQRQRQASLLMTAPSTSAPPLIVPNNPSPVVNHLFVGKQLVEKKSGNAYQKRVSRSSSIDGVVKALTPTLSDELSTRLDLYDSSQQSTRQTLRYKVKKHKPVITKSLSASASEAASRLAAEARLEAAIREGMERNRVVCRSSDASDDYDGDVTPKEYLPEKCCISRQHSTASSSSTDSVFSHHSPQHQLTLHSPHTLHQSSTSIIQRGCSQEVITPTKPFSPFPKPATGILSAKKAKIGVQLGLYKPENALAYMSPAQRKQFLKEGKHFSGRMAIGSHSSLW